MRLVRWFARGRNGLRKPGEQTTPRQLSDSLGFKYVFVPKAAARDPELAERLALVDALRLGDARFADVASRELDKFLSGRA